MSASTESGAKQPRRARHQGRRRRLSLGRTIQEPGAPAHHVLLGAGMIVIEGLDLRQVEPGIYEMFCFLPLRVVGSDGAPARVVLRRS